jgi:hypothetical protein
MGNLFFFTIFTFASAQNCNLVVPPNALTAQGLATPYISINCDQTNPTQ